MDKLKLIQIIEKELEELKILSQEITESDEKTSLIIDLALSKARLLCQEIELLRELTAKSVANVTDDSPEENEEEQMDEDEVSDVSISDPELEIVELEETELEDAPEFDDEFEPEGADDEETTEVDDNKKTTEDDLTDDEDDLDQNELEFIEEEIEEEGLIEFGVDNEDEIEEDMEEEPQSSPTIESTELKTDFQAGVREITIDMDDDDDLEPVKVSTPAAPVERPVMREIPKPEELIQEKPVVGKPFPKEPSLNDTIGETKSTEPPLSVGSISSLRASIGLNDRFLFIREIFGNNTDKYNTIIDQLDKLETQQQAVELLKANLTLQKNETSMKFVDLLKRRFSK